MGDDFAVVICTRNLRCIACRRIIKRGDQAYRWIMWDNNYSVAPEVYYYCYSEDIHPDEAMQMSIAQHKRKICDIKAKR